jgi:hypothetical protein
MATDAAPEPTQPAIAAIETPRKLSEELAHLQVTFAERAVQLQEVITALRGRAYLLLLVLLSLPFCTPIPLPGLSTPFGLVLAVIGLRLALGLKPWLPKKLLYTAMPPGFLAKLLRITQNIVRIFEKLLRPRWAAFTNTETLRRLHAFAIFLAGLALLLPLPIPFTNMFPAWAVLLLACGLLERDGLFVLAGHVVFAAGVAYFILLGDAAQRLFEAARAWLFG